MTPAFRFLILAAFAGLSGMANPALAVESNDHLDLSPDGHTIAFDGGERGSKNIYLLDLETNSCRLLVDMQEDLFVPSWSLDGKQVAFTAADGDRRLIMVADIETGRIRELVDSKTVSSIVWAPEGEKLVFSYAMDDGTADLYSVDILTAEVKPLIVSKGSERYPFWSAALEKYIYSADATGALELYSYDPGTKERHQLTADGVGKYVPRVSPDGQKISFAAIVGDHFDQFVMNADATGTKNLTNQPGHDLFGTWSLDGKTLYFESTRDRGNLNGDNGYDFYAYDFATDSVTRVTTPETCR